MGMFQQRYVDRHGIWHKPAYTQRHMAFGGSQNQSAFRPLIYPARKMSKRSTQADQGAGRAEGKRTEVFISATSGDLRTVREIIKQGLLTMGCFPIEQTNFEPDYRTVLQMLETRIAQCDAVIHIVGVRFGAEPDPASVPEGETWRSYTQMEVEIARKLGKKLYVFLCPEDFPYDEESQAESDEKRELQRAYRQQVVERESLHTPVRSREDIAVKVRELKFELEKLKGAIAHDRTRTFAVLAGLLIALAAIPRASGGGWSTDLRQRRKRWPGSCVMIR